MELGGIVTGQLSWRRLAVLISGLPATSRLARAMHPQNAWTQSDYLIAQAADNTALVADELAAFRWLWTSANTKKGAKKPTRPEPYPRLPRPGQQHQDKPSANPPRRRMSPGEAARALAARGSAA